MTEPVLLPNDIHEIIGDMNIWDAIRLQRAQLAARDLEVKALRDALEDAAKSLETLARAGTKDQPLLEDLFQIRGYANSRAISARAALKGGTG